MRCWKCGAAIADGAKFCTECGADQRKAPVQQQTVYQQSGGSAQQPKKKRSLLKTFLIALVVYVLARGLGYMVGSGTFSLDQFMKGVLPDSRTSTSSTASSMVPSDLITMKKVLYEGEDSGITTYEVVYYGMNSKKIVGITEVMLASKSYGYTREYLESVDLTEVYPSFVKVDIFDGGDHWCVRAVMDDLGTASRMQQLVDKGLITLVGGGKVTGGIEAEGYIQSILDGGARYASTDETSKLHLSD